MNLAQKLKILDFLKSAERLANIAKKSSVNECTVK